MVEHWYSVVYVAAYRCTTIIQIHHLFVKILNISHYIRNFKELFSTGSKKDPSSDLSTGFGKDFEKLPQVIADGNGILSIAVLRW